MLPQQDKTTLPAQDYSYPLIIQSRQQAAFQQTLFSSVRSKFNCLETVCGSGALLCVSCGSRSGCSSGTSRSSRLRARNPRGRLAEVALVVAWLCRPLDLPQRLVAQPCSLYLATGAGTHLLPAAVAGGIWAERQSAVPAFIGPVQTKRPVHPPPPPRAGSLPAEGRGAGKRRGLGPSWGQRGDGRCERLPSQTGRAWSRARARWEPEGCCCDTGCSDLTWSRCAEQPALAGLLRTRGWKVSGGSPWDSALGLR